MKKVIALLSIVSLVFGMSVALAGNNATIIDWDDSNLVQTRNNTNTFQVNHNAFAKIESKLEVEVETGENTIVAGDDLDAGGIASGDAELNYQDQSDVNGLAVEYAACPCEGASENNLAGTDVDDSNAVQTDNNTNAEQINSQVYLEERSDEEFEAETGENAAVAGGDVGEDSPVTVSSGKATLNLLRGKLRNFVSVIRL